MSEATFWGNLMWIALFLIIGVNFGPALMRALRGNPEKPQWPTREIYRIRVEQDGQFSVTATSIPLTRGEWIIQAVKVGD